MYKPVLKLMIFTLVLVGAGMMLSSSTVSADTGGCNGNLYSDTTKGVNSGQHSNAMAGMVVHATNADTGNPINTSYTLNSYLADFNYGSAFGPPPKLNKDDRIFAWPLGNGRSHSESFSTGETLHNGSNSYSCNGWSVIGPGVPDSSGNRQDGNRHVLDCGQEDVTGDSKNTHFYISHIDNPAGQSGHWGAKYWKVNRWEPLSPDVNHDANNKANDFTVDNGSNLQLQLIWYPDPDWTLKGYSNAEDSTIAAGENTNFNHKVHNQGPSDARYYWHLEGCYHADGTNCTESDFSGGNDGGNAISSAGKPNTHNGSPDSVGQGNDVPSKNTYNYKFDSGAPNGARYCQRINYTNKDGPNTTEGHSDSDCTVKSPPKNPRAPELACNVLKVKSYGSYSEGDGNGGTVERETRAKVNIGGAWITHTYWSKAGPDNGDSGELGYTNRDASDNYVPNSDGSKQTTDWKQWNLVPYNRDITVTVQYQYKKNGTTWTDFDGGGGNNPAAPNINRGASNPVPCYRPTCTINAVHGNLFDNQSVEAGKPAYVSVTINNPDPSPTDLDGVPLRDAYVEGYGKTSDHVDIDPGGSKTPSWIQIDAPGTAQNWTVKFNLKSGVSDGLPAITCERPASVYKQADFGYTPSAKLDDQENPTTITYSTKVTSNFATTVNLPTFHSVTKVPPSTLIDQPSPQPTTLAPSGFQWGGSSPITPGSAQVGDQFCTTIWSGAQGSNRRITGGYVDGNGNITAPEYADAAKDCDTVHNEPYVHFNGADVSAGGKFEDEGGSCNNPGEIDTFSKESATGNPVGSGVHIGALAIGPIEGFNSANVRDSSPIAPIGLTFSNTENTTGGAGNARNHGGKLGGNNCVIDYYGTKPSDTPVSAGSSVDISANSATVSKVTKYYEPPTGTALTITGGNIANNNSEVIYVKGDVNIKGNITLADNWGTIEAIPSLYIIASGNIYISKDVTQLDGIYVAQPRQSTPNTGYINTCTDGPKVYSNPAAGDSTYPWSKCRSQLVVNGAFVAKGVYLERTLGTLRKGQSGEYYKKAPLARDCDTVGTNTGDCAAEVFNFGAEQYLAQPAIPARTGPNKGVYDYITSLAPVL